MKKIELIATALGSDRYYLSLYNMRDGDKTWSRLNIEDTETSKWARRDFDGNGHFALAKKEYDEIVYGDKIPLQYQWM